jgi:hypothetical protein
MKQGAQFLNWMFKFIPLSHDEVNVKQASSEDEEKALKWGESRSKTYEK